VGGVKESLCLTHTHTQSHTHTYTDVEAFFALIDLDGSGIVDEAEFMEFIKDVEAMSK